MRRWRSANILPPRSTPRRKLPEDDLPGPTASLGDDLLGDRERLLRAQADERRAKADSAGLALAIERGEYRALAEIEEWDRARIAIVKRGLLSLGRQVAPLVIGLSVHEAEVIIHRACRDLLTRFASVK
ncbi:MAG: hypothetical protein V2A73_21405 [Pseudomonadota bacterium]